MPDSKEALCTYSFTDGTWVRPVEGRHLCLALSSPVISMVTGIVNAMFGGMMMR